MGAAARGNDLLNLGKSRHHLLRHRHKFVVGTRRGHNAKNVLRVVLAAHHNVAAFHQRRHYVLRGLAVLPQVAAVVHIGRNGDAQPACGLNGLARGLGRRRRNGRRDACPVQPAGILQDFVPVEIRRVELLESRAGAVVHHFAGAHPRSYFQKVQPQPVAPEYGVRQVHAQAAELLRGGLAQIIGREAGNVGGGHAQHRQRRAHVGVAAPVVHFEAGGLGKPVVQRRRKPHHDFAKRDNLLHTLRAWKLEDVKTWSGTVMLHLAPAQWKHDRSFFAHLRLQPLQLQ